MSEMKPLLDESLSPDLRELLRSAEGDVPSAAESKQTRILAAIAASATPGATTVPAGPDAPAATRPPGLGTVARTWKWSVPAACLIVTAGILALRRPAPPHLGEDPTPSTAAAAAEIDGPRSPVIAPADGEPAPATSLRVEDLPDVRPSGSAPAVVRKVEAPLDAELAAIDGARAALTSGRSEEALRAIELYRRDFTKPHFAIEADALEVQALAGAGRVDEARRRAEVFLRAHPQSPYAQRVRSSVAHPAPSSD